MVTLLKTLLTGLALSLMMGCCAWWVDRDDDRMSYSSDPPWRDSATMTSRKTVIHDGVTHETVYTERRGIPYPDRASAAWW